MSSVLTMEGSIVDRPGDASLGFGGTIDIGTIRSLSAGRIVPCTLASDAVVDVPLGGMSVNVLIVIAPAKVRVRITSADGTTAEIPTTKLILFTDDVPITAVDIMRVAGAASSSPAIFVGQKF